MKNLLTIAALAVVSSSFAVTYGPSSFGNIPDFAASVPGSASNTIAVGTGITSVNSVTLRGLTHTWAGDLVVTITAPDATSVSLVARLGSTTPTGFGTSNNFGGDYTFVGDGSGANLWTAVAVAGVIPGGTYNATGALSSTPVSFAGLSNQAAGDWTLTITDNAAGDTGALVEWEFDATPVPEPGTMIALGLGAAAMIRRRRNSK